MAILFMPGEGLNARKKLISAIWPRSLNFLSNNICVVLIVFADHVNIGIEPKIIVLLCTVQELWLYYYA